MKKVWIFIVLLSLILSACNAGNNTVSTTERNANTDAAAPASDGSQTQEAPGQGDLPEISKVLLGTFLLEDTEYAVTAEQASSLLPLWKGLNALQNSDTVTNAELEGLYSQIISAMTEEQMAQIKSMDISFESMGTVMGELGLGGSGQGGQGGPGGNMGDLTEDQIATMQAEREANGDSRFSERPAREGGFPNGGQGSSPGGFTGEGDNAGRMAMQASGEDSFKMPEQAGDPSLRLMSRLFEPLIELLQSKIG